MWFIDNELMKTNDHMPTKGFREITLMCDFHPLQSVLSPHILFKKQYDGVQTEQIERSTQPLVYMAIMLLSKTSWCDIFATGGNA
jgi:hypothetical protein